MGAVVSKLNPELGLTENINIADFDPGLFFRFSKVLYSTVTPPLPIKYWINEPADNLREMTQPEKDVVDAAIEAARIQAIKDSIIEALSEPVVITTLSESSSAVGLTITTNVTDIIVDDEFIATSDTNFEKFFNVTLSLNTDSEIFTIHVFERTSEDSFGDVPEGQKTVNLIDTYQLDAGGTTLTKL